MSIHDPAPAPWPARLLAVFRIVAGVIFISSGTMKLFGVPALPPGTPPIGFMSQMWIGGVLEVVGGAMIVLGAFTRPVAFVLSGMMAVAYFQFHQPQAFWPTQNGGIPAILYCFFFLYLVAAGPGAWSVDEALAAPRGRGAHV